MYVSKILVAASVYLLPSRSTAVAVRGTHISVATGPNSSLTGSVHIETSPASPNITVLSSQVYKDPTVPDPDYNTAYAGPVHEKEWLYYLQIFSPTWWRMNLDTITATACLCSHKHDLHAIGRVASFVQYDYYSHFHQKSYSGHKICGPIEAQEGDNHCWSTATGDHYIGVKPDRDTLCAPSQDDGETLCVNFGEAGKRFMTWHGHKRNFDREGTHQWHESADYVKKLCTFHCGDKFVMEMDEDGMHGPSYVASWFPPKPIPW